MKKTIGILGGMGPEATAYFYTLIIKNTLALRDQEHIRILIWNDPKIPPRTDAILKRGPSPLPSLLKGVGILERGGAGLIVMPCMTAHYWASGIAARANVPFVNLLDASLASVRKYFPKLKTAGLLASTGTVASGLWAKTFAKHGIQVIVPRPDEQDRIMAAIAGKNGIKSGVTTGGPRRTILNMARRLIDRGAEAIIAGCTEVPLVLRDGDLSVPLIEPMTIGARACVRRAGYKTTDDKIKGVIAAPQGSSQ